MVMADSPFELFSSVRYDPVLTNLPTLPAYAHAGWNSQRSSPFYMLDFHRDRLLRAATHWGWEAAVAAVAGDSGLARLEQVLKTALHDHVSSGGGPLRCRVTLNELGRLHCDTSAAAATALVGLVPPQLPPPGYMVVTGPNSGQEPANSSPLLPLLRAEWGQQPYQVTVDMGRTAASPYTHYKTTRRQMYDDARRRAGIALHERKEVLLINSETGTIMDGSITTVYLWRGGRWVTPPVPSVYDQKAGSGGLDGTSRRWALERGFAVQEEVQSASLVDGEECWLSNGVRGFMYGKISIPASN